MLRVLSLSISVITLAPYLTVMAQSASYPKELRGYKVERAVVELKNDARKKESFEEQQLMTFGELKVDSISPLGIGLIASVVVAPVKQKGSVEFLVFEDVVVNGTSVQIDEYKHTFELPNQKRLVLKEPLKFFIYLPSAVLAAIGEWSDSKESWAITGRVYVFGKFKKAIFSFKRCIPVELNLTMRNPLKT